MGPVPDRHDHDVDPGRTVGQAATLLGVTVRTLHHWDDIGLAHPSGRSAAGYRLYSDRDLDRLQRIVVHRALGLDLEAIRAVLDEPGAGTVAALRSERARLEEQIDDLHALTAGLDRLIEAHERGPLLSAEEQHDVLGPGWDPQWSTTARERWGDTTQWAEYAERSAARTPDDWREVVRASTAFDHELAVAMDAGVEPGSSAAEALVDRHREVFSAYFPITREMQVILARTAASEPAFREHQDAVRPGLGAWFRGLVEASAAEHGIDPDTAEWR